jgi:hypothetical protein
MTDPKETFYLYWQQDHLEYLEPGDLIAIQIKGRNIPCIFIGQKVSSIGNHNVRATYPYIPTYKSSDYKKGNVEEWRETTYWSDINLSHRVLPTTIDAFPVQIHEQVKNKQKEIRS